MFKIHSNCNFVGLFHHPFWFYPLLALLGITFHLFFFKNYIVWLRITDQGLVPEMRIWSILLIKSDLKWCIVSFWIRTISCSDRRIYQVYGPNPHPFYSLKQLDNQKDCVFKGESTPHDICCFLINILLRKEKDWCNIEYWLVNDRLVGWLRTLHDISVMRQW